MAIIDYLGHAGFLVEHRGLRLLIDPWFYPAFLGSWFPYPDNRFLLEPTLGQPVDFLYLSHCHEDHFDHRFLENLNKDIQILCPAYRSRALQKRLLAMGFTRVRPMAHRESLPLGDGLAVTIYLDTGHKEDSALLVETDGFRFLDLNDCNTPLSELPSGVELLAAQFSGAMWYPNCYDYPPALMREKVAKVRKDLMETLVSKCRVTGTAAYLPSAGPACFLDPCLAQYNDRSETIFPLWDDVETSFRAALPDTSIVRAQPGDRIHVGAEGPRVEAYAGPRPSTDLTEYRARRRPEWEAFHAGPDQPVSSEEVTSYFATLQRRNRHALRDFSKTVRLTADGRAWTVRLGELAQDFVIEGEEPYDPQYGLLMSNRVLRAVLDGAVGWEEALLSMRVQLRRNPDVFDSRFLGLLRYGNEPVQTMQMMRELERDEMIERDGLRLQRFCPHAGEDLTYAEIHDGIIECPRHHWKWDATTGVCLEGGCLPLRVQSAQTQSSSQKEKEPA